VKKLVGITAILMCMIAAACGAPPNPLLGKWKLVNPGGTPSRLYAYCATAMAFTDTTQTFTTAGKASSSKISYNAAQTATYPTTVFVMGDAGMHTTYLFSSKDKLKVDTAAGCTYQRE
jgi:hypothetical protein